MHHSISSRISVSRKSRGTGKSASVLSADRRECREDWISVLYWQTVRIQTTRSSAIEFVYCTGVCLCSTDGDLKQQSVKKLTQEDTNSPKTHAQLKQCWRFVVVAIIAVFFCLFILDCLLVLFCDCFLLFCLFSLSRLYIPLYTPIVDLQILHLYLIHITKNISSL